MKVILKDFKTQRNVFKEYLFHFLTRSTKTIGLVMRNIEHFAKHKNATPKTTHLIKTSCQFTLVVLGLTH